MCEWQCVCINVQCFVNPRLGYRVYGSIPVPSKTIPKTSPRSESVVRHKLYALLDAHLRINGIEASNVLSTSSAHPSLSVQLVAPRTYGGSTNAKSSVPVPEHSLPADNGVQPESTPSPSSLEPCQPEELDTSSPNSTHDSTGTSQADLGTYGGTAP